MFSLPLSAPTPDPHRTLSQIGDFPFGLSSLTLTPNGDDTFTQWWFRGSLLSNNSKHFIDPSDSYSLTISDLEFTDAGVYQAEEIGRTPPTLFNFEITIFGMPGS